MLVTTKELLCVANAENKAIGAFNITGLETLQAVLQAAESRKEPVILQFAQVHEEEQIISLNIIGPIMVMMADQATIPVAVHLDHGVDLHILKKALDMGFTSIMFDGSSLPYGENIAYTRMAVSMAQEYGASVEAEIGVPIVMHGGSGVSEADYDIVIENGVRKVNYYTYMAKSGGEAARAYASASDIVYFHDIANTAIAAMRSNVEEALRIFAHHRED